VKEIHRRVRRERRGKKREKKRLKEKAGRGLHGLKDYMD
jgi:hypothetical protein